MSMDIATGSRSIDLDPRHLLEEASRESRAATARMLRRRRPAPILFLITVDGSVVLMEPGQDPSSR